jgi:SAM-dependent methyltransferase
VKLDEWFYTLDDTLWLRIDEECREEAAFIKRVLRLRKGQSVLDAPCGAGRVAYHLAKMGCWVTGVDLRAAFVERAQRRFLNEDLAGEFKVMDLRHLDFIEDFDGICNWGGSFGYFNDAENLDVLRRYARALQPNGRIVIDQPNREGLLRNFMAEVHPSEGRTYLNRWDKKTQRIITERILDGRNDPGNVSSVRLYTPQQMRLLFEGAGLDLVEMHGSLSGNSFVRSSRRIYFVGRKRMY